MTSEQARTEIARRELARRQSTPEQTQQGTIADLAIGGGTLAGAGAVGYGTKKMWDYMAPIRTKTAGHLVNQLIKPRHKEYMFGKNPGQGVAQEGLFANSLEGLGSKVDERLGQLQAYTKNLYSLDENKVKVTNQRQSFKPLVEAIDEFGKAPNVHASKINELKTIMGDLRKSIPANFKLSEVPVDLAYQLKQVVKNMQKWTVDNPSDHIMNKALKSTYHNIDNAIDIAIPSLKEINSRTANLISAKQAIKNQLELVSKRDPLEYRGVVNLATSPLRSTVVKTGLAKILSEKFGFIPKAAGKLGRGTAGTVGGIANFVDALKYAYDPEQYMVGLETGGMGELAPKGSEEREMQLGRII